MEQFYPGSQVTVVDGEEITVRTMQNATSYHAVPNNPGNYSLLTIDTRAAPLNVRAIEQVSGCEIIPETIQHRELNTFAQVEC